MNSDHFLYPLSCGLCEEPASDLQISTLSSILTSDSHPHWRLLRGLRLEEIKMLTSKAFVNWKASDQIRRVRTLLSLSIEPFSRAGEIKHKVHGVGQKLHAVIAAVLSNQSIPSCPPPAGKFVSAPPAALVALYLAQQGGAEALNEQELRECAQLLCEESLQDEIVLGEVTCIGFRAVRSCITKDIPLIQEVKRNKQKAYKLTELGTRVAQGLLTCFQQHRGTTAATMHRNEISGYGTGPGVYVVIDHREQGGDNGHIHSILDGLKQKAVKFVTRALPIGDYLFIVRNDVGAEYVIPVVIERKRLDDLGKSMIDGRYKRQKDIIRGCKMFQRRVYLIEGTFARYRHELALMGVCLADSCVKKSLF